MNLSRRYIIKKAIPHIANPNTFEETLLGSFDTEEESFDFLYDPELPVLTDGEYIIWDTVENIEI